jgi:hypothetical protein
MKWMISSSRNFRNPNEVGSNYLQATAAGTGKGIITGNPVIRISGEILTLSAVSLPLPFNQPDSSGQRDKGVYSRYNGNRCRCKK